jgi:hypothetical protein
MKFIELLEESTNKTISERPVGFIKQGLTKLASKLPGSIGARAQGSAEVGQVANQLYKEFMTYLGRTGQGMTDAALRDFLSKENIDAAIIDKHLPPQAKTAAPATQSPSAPAAKTRTGGKVAGTLSTNPRAVQRRQATAAARATSAGLTVAKPAAPKATP